MFKFASCCCGRNDVTVLCRSIRNIKKKIEALAVAIKEIGLEVNAEKPK
jgi:hypothetical protein